MSMDPYSPCFCGSGKKFKWCCQNIYAEIQQAFVKNQSKQHEAARRLIDQVVQKNPGNPQAWACHAQFLIARDEAEAAELSLDKAFEINPNHPFGLLLKAQLRLEERENEGALLLARRAAEAYDPEAREYLSDVYLIIYQCELTQNRPLAAGAAIRTIIRCDPSNADMRRELEQVFGEDRLFPPCACKEFELIASRSQIEGEHRRQWDLIMERADSPRLGALAKAFQLFAELDPNDAAAWHNLGLARGWLGENRAAIEALERYVDLEPDEDKAAEMAAVIEVLRYGRGMEDEAEHHTYSAEYDVRDHRPFVDLLKHWMEQNTMLGMPSPREGTIAARLLEPIEDEIVTSASMAGEERRLTANLLADAERLRLWGPFKDRLARVQDHLERSIGMAVSLKDEGKSNAGFGSIVADAVRYPMGSFSEEHVKRKIIEGARHYFEDKWIHQPLRTLGGVAPVHAANDPKLRKRLRGVVQFYAECAAFEIITEYDFDSLRGKLGLLDARPTIVRETKDTLNVAEMDAEALARLSAEQLSSTELEQAYRTAENLDASELRHRFATALVERTPEAGSAERYSIFAYLIDLSLGQSDTEEALNWIDAGERHDCEHNEGRRRNEYELRRAQVHAQRGDVDEAADTFGRLIVRAPADLQYRGKAVEAMLSLKQGKKAIEFATAGLEAARKQNDPDAEKYLMELLDAAKKQAE